MPCWQEKDAMKLYSAEKGQEVIVCPLLEIHVYITPTFYKGTERVFHVCPSFLLRPAAKRKTPGYCDNLENN